MGKQAELLGQLIKEFKAAQKFGPDASEEMVRTVDANVVGFANFLLEKHYTDNLMTMRDMFISAGVQGVLAAHSGPDIAMPSSEWIADYAILLADQIMERRIEK